jgi:hypothetical protein
MLRQEGLPASLFAFGIVPRAEQKRFQSWKVFEIHLHFCFGKSFFHLSDVTRDFSPPFKPCAIWSI